MSIYQINTGSGGTIDLSYINDRFHGKRLVLNIDQSGNVNNGEGSASIVISDQEIKDLIALLNGYLMSVYGDPYVVVAEHLINPCVKVTIDTEHPAYLDFKKDHPDFNPDDINGTSQP